MLVCKFRETESRRGGLRVVRPFLARISLTFWARRSTARAWRFWAPAELEQEARERWPMLATPSRRAMSRFILLWSCFSPGWAETRPAMARPAAERAVMRTIVCVRKNCWYQDNERMSKTIVLVFLLLLKRMLLRWLLLVRKRSPR